MDLGGFFPEKLSELCTCLAFAKFTDYGEEWEFRVELENISSF